MSFHRDRKKIIGYTGFGHTQDLEYIEDILLEVLSEYPDWSLELIFMVLLFDFAYTR